MSISDFSQIKTSGQLQHAFIDHGILKTCVLLAIFVFLFHLSRVLYSVYLGPLSKVPGPRLAAATPLWLLYQSYQCRKAHAVEECFQKYGPLVRIGPRTVALNTEQGMRKVYGVGSKFMKSEWYTTWAFKGFDSMFTMRDTKLHADRRRVVANLMTKTSIVQYMDDVKQHVKDMKKLCLKAGQENRSMNFRSLWRYFAMDVVGSSVLGESFGLMKTGKQHRFIYDLDACFATLPPRGYLPTWVWWLITKIPHPQLQDILGGEDRVVQYGRDIIAEKTRRAEENGGKITANDAKTIVGRFIEHRDQNNKPLPQGEIDSEVAVYYLAGADTTSTTLSFLSWELASKPHLQERLLKELRENMPNADEVPALEDVESWPFLNALIQEALRLYAPAPSILERVAPHGGAVIEGHYLPAGTVIGTQSFSMHRKKEVFPDPHSFNPDRWLNATEEMKRHLMTFGLGSRVCIGMHLAMLELRLSITSLIREFELRPLPDQDPEAMRMVDTWIATPAGKDVNLLVIPRDM